MKILLIGGTGLVGSYLLPDLIENKHSVYAITRSESKISKINSLGAVCVPGDILNPDSFISSISNIDLLILLAMPGVKPGQRITGKKFNRLREETNGFFINTLNLAERFKIHVILPSGTSFNTTGNELADETWPILRKGLARIGSDTDKMVNDAIESKKPQVVQLLYGRIYGNGGLFRVLFNMIKKGRYRIIGKGENYLPNIHAKDAAQAIIKVIEKMPVGEKFIIADDEPVTQKEFAYHMADIINIRRPGSIPGFVIKAVLGRDLYEIITMNCKVSNAKAKEYLHWKPEYPSYKEGLKAVIKEMQENQPLFYS
jgi:nucleoside-diphosphate-sugar epimerase